MSIMRLNKKDLNIPIKEKQCVIGLESKAWLYAEYKKHII